MTAQVGCMVSLRHDGGEGQYAVQLRHYDQLKDALDRKETGWIELESIHADGKLFCRLEDIADLFCSTEAYAEDRNAWLERERLQGDG